MTKREFADLLEELGLHLEGEALDVAFVRFRELEEDHGS